MQRSTNELGVLSAPNLALASFGHSVWGTRDKLEKENKCENNLRLLYSISRICRMLPSRTKERSQIRITITEAKEIPPEESRVGKLLLNCESPQR